MRLLIASNFPICLCLILYSDGARVTWYEPLPVKTVLSTGDDPTPAKKELFEGYPASLSWNFSSTSVKVFAVSITFNTDHLATSGPEGLDARVEDAFKDRFNFTWISQRLTLIIFKVTAAYDESNGEFSCELITSAGGWIRKIQVKIVERPEIVDLTSDQDVCEHSKVILSCNASGNPKPNITWTRVWKNGTDSRALQSTDSNFVMRNIERSSNGTYRCTAFNGVGNAIDQTVEVIVRYSASVVRVVRSSNAVHEGDAYTLICKVSGDPMPNVIWVKVSNNQSSDGNVLNFTNIRRNDLGDYRCEASNRCGTKAKTEPMIIVPVSPEGTKAPAEELESWIIILNVVGVLLLIALVGNICCWYFKRKICIVVIIEFIGKHICKVHTNGGQSTETEAGYTRVEASSR